MITTLNLIGAFITSHGYLFFLCERESLRCPLFTNFELQPSVSDCSHHAAHGIFRTESPYKCKLIHFNQYLPFPPCLAPGNHHSTLCSCEFNFSFFLFFLIPHISDTIQYLFFSVWLVSLMDVLIMSKSREAKHFN